MCCFSHHEPLLHFDSTLCGCLLFSLLSLASSCFRIPKFFYGVRASLRSTLQSVSVSHFGHGVVILTSFGVEPQQVFWTVAESLVVRQDSTGPSGTTVGSSRPTDWAVLFFAGLRL